MRCPARVTAILALSSLLAAPVARTQEIWVSGFLSQAVHRYAFTDGTYLGPLVQAAGPQGITHGPDGSVFVVAEGADRILHLEDGRVKNLMDAVGDDAGRLLSALTPLLERFGPNLYAFPGIVSVAAAATWRMRAVAFAGVSKYPARVKCALLGWTALTDALARSGQDISRAATAARAQSTTAEPTTAQPTGAKS